MGVAKGVATGGALHNYHGHLIRSVCKLIDANLVMLKYLTADVVALIRTPDIFRTPSFVHTRGSPEEKVALLAGPTRCFPLTDTHIVTAA
jgi:hypothetical protein